MIHINDPEILLVMPFELVITTPIQLCVVVLMHVKSVMRGIPVLINIKSV